MPDVMFIVPDLDIQSVIENLHQESQRLGIGEYTFSAYRHYMRDSGVRMEAEIAARANRGQGAERERYVVAVLDYHGSGARGDIGKCAERIEQKLNRVSFDRGNVLAVFIEPELEAWFFSDTIELARAIGLSHAQLQRFIEGANRKFPSNLEKQLQHVLYLRNRDLRPPVDIEDVIRRIDMSKWLLEPSFHKLVTAMSKWFPV